MDQHLDSGGSAVDAPECDRGNDTPSLVLERRFGQFLRELAHELGNLTFPLQMIIDLQGRPGQLTPEELGESLQGHLSELIAMTNRFQQIGRCVSGHLEPQFRQVPVGGIVQGAVAACRRMFEDRGHTLNLESANSQTVIRADRDLLQMAIVELLQNAARYTPARGRIELRVSQHDTLVEFVVHDNGPGIPENLRSCVFELFVHGNPKLDFQTGRLGCGLALVRTIATAHGGSAAVRSTSADGTEIVFSIPRM